MRDMRNLPLRTVALAGSLAAAFALAVAHVAELGFGLVPCALCLWERWPYRVALVVGLLAALLPRHARWLLAVMLAAVLAGVAMAITHVGVEFRWWPSPLPECSAPAFGGGSIADRLAAMPARPAKPCDDPTFLIPGVPLSMAAMNLLFALVFSAFLAIFTVRRTLPR